MTDIVKMSCREDTDFLLSILRMSCREDTDFLLSILRYVNFKFVYFGKLL
jgi:hypothetical protein